VGGGGGAPFVSSVDLVRFFFFYPPFANLLQGRGRGGGSIGWRSDSSLHLLQTFCKSKGGGAGGGRAGVAGWIPR
jgi:hypothetical protein